MISYEELQKILPDPVRVEIFEEDIDEDPSQFFILINEKLEEHNERFYKKIDRVKQEIGDCEGLLENEFAIFVGNTMVLKGRVPDDIMNYDSYIAYEVATVLEVWHDRIIEVQEDNIAKLKELDAEGYDEMLYAYYYYAHNRRKMFFYLKKLATRYPHSKYMRRLIGAYKRGFDGNKEKFQMGQKLAGDNLTDSVF